MLKYSYESIHDAEEIYFPLKIQTPFPSSIQNSVIPPVFFMFKSRALWQTNVKELLRDC